MIRVGFDPDYVLVLLVNQTGPIKPGDDFVLYASPEKDWYEKASRVQTTNIKARGALPLEMLWQQNQNRKRTES